MSRAFTMVELLVVFALISILIGAGIGISRQAGRRQAVAGAAEDLAQAMRQARDYAQAGRKDGSCSAALDGWQVEVKTDRYIVSGKCGVTFGARTVIYAGGVSATIGTVLFKPLSLGADLASDLVITLSRSGAGPQTVTVSKVGEVKVGP